MQRWDRGVDDPRAGSLVPSPLQQTHGCGEGPVQAELGHVGGAGEPVQIEVMHGGPQGRVVLVVHLLQEVRGRGNLQVRIARDRSHERSAEDALPHADVAVEAYHVPRPRVRSLRWREELRGERENWGGEGFIFFFPQGAHSIVVLFALIRKSQKMGI